MKKIITVVSLGLALSQTAVAQQQKSNVNYVDPTIGSVGLILVPTRPVAHLPNSMIRVFPSRKDQLDDQINFFPLTISSHRQPSLFSLMPYSGEVNKESWKKSFTWDNEITTPYYYSVRLEENGDSIEFAPSARSGFFRFHFKNNSPHFLRLGVLNNAGTINVQGKRIITGTDSVKGMPAFFYAKINADIDGTNYADKSQKKLLARLSDKKQTVEFRYGISFISIEQAKENLQKEISNLPFNKIKENAYKTWDAALSKIDVKGGTAAQKRVFYTSLYRSYERMIDINEYGKYYSSYDHQVHKSDKPFFVDNWLWDTYIALEPLHTILDPRIQENKISSYISMYEQSGWMPSFALAFGDDPCMTGNHAAAWMADVWMKGYRNFDIKKAYEGLKKNSLEATLLPWRNGPATSLDSFYNQNGYMPSLHAGEAETVKDVHSFEKRQAVAVTLENSYDDWCIAQLAEAAGSKEDKELFLKRAAFYKNVFRTDKGFMWPKDASGKWIEPFDPKFSGGQGGREYTTENNVYTYNWSVKHDFKGLFELMGGRKKAEEKLDALFREDLGRSKYVLWNTFPDATGLVGQFVMGNEPSFHIPYVYNYTGSPWKTQKRIRMLLDTWFTDNLFGIPGDEDGGGMTAFVVFSMMGFFPVTPGVPVYNIGSPVFENVSMKLPNGKTFTIVAKNNSATNKYIQSATLNGKVLNQAWFTHTDLMNGGKLELIMGGIPNKTWGSNIESAPPSEMMLNPDKMQ
jgi:predicted alpha-1,2-mannosidase